jgi:hypothetical protein
MLAGTPIRWAIMAGVAACGYFMITEKSAASRAYAFLFSVVLWQAYYILMMWEADAIRASAKRKCASCAKEISEEKEAK